MPVFSVIVPIYRVECYLEQCIESVLHQTFPDFELILVDDGSPDRCPQICDEYAAKDPRVKVIHKENGGLVSARIAGAEAAVGSFVACVDGDDWIADNYLQLFHDAILQYDPDILSCGDIETDGEHCVPKDPNYPCKLYTKEAIRKELFPFLLENSKGECFSGPVSGKVFRRALYVRNQKEVPHGISIGEDAACTKLCLCEADSFYQIGCCCYYYRTNPSSMTKSKKTLNPYEPKLLGEHFARHACEAIPDYAQQLARLVVHHLFNAVVTQFYEKIGYRKTVQKIRTVLKDPFYSQAIRDCKYSPSCCKGQLARFALRHRCFFLMWLYSKIK